MDVQRLKPGVLPQGLRILAHLVRPVWVHTTASRMRKPSTWPRNAQTVQVAKSRSLRVTSVLLMFIIGTQLQRPAAAVRTVGE